MVTAREVEALSADVPVHAGELHAHWLEGPSSADRLDVGLVTMSPGGVTPRHTHIGGQVLVVTAGRGFIEADGDRRLLAPGDVVVCPPGETHVHGALDDEALAHLTITTRGYALPD